jgi:hypothetical protein
MIYEIMTGETFNFGQSGSADSMNDAVVKYFNNPWYGAICGCSLM